MSDQQTAAIRIDAFFVRASRAAARACCPRRPRGAPQLCRSTHIGRPSCKPESVFRLLLELGYEVIRAGVEQARTASATMQKCPGSASPPNGWHQRGYAISSEISLAIPQEISVIGPRDCC